MFYSLKTKLFLIILFVNTLLILSVLSLNGASFNRSFSDYVNKQESRHLDPILDTLALYRQNRDDWSELEAKPERWIELINSGYMAPPQERRRSDFPPPYLNKLMLKSEQEKIIIGKQEWAERALWLPILDPDEDILGYIGYLPNERFDAQVDRIFRNQFEQQIRWIGFFVLVFSGLFAIIISGAIVRPLRKISSALADMATGNYNAKIGHVSKDELGQLAKDVSHLAYTLSENQKSRSQWVTDIAHELRTPIAVFLADIESVQDGVRRADDDWLKSMHKQAGRLRRLVNDLNELSVSEVGALQYRFNFVDLNALTRNCVEQYQQQLEQAEVSVVVSSKGEEFICSADEQRIEQLISNLMQNTLRYTDAPGHLQVSIIAELDSVTIRWADSSPGVNTTDLDKLFHRLYRVDASRNRETGGSGLGLAIVKNIVDAHQGSIQAQHSTLGGVTIKIVLPKLLQE